MSEVIGSLAGVSTITPHANKWAPTVAAILERAELLAKNEELAWQCPDEKTAAILKANLKPQQHGLRAVAEGAVLKVWKQRKEVAA